MEFLLTNVTPIHLTIKNVFIYKKRKGRKEGREEGRNRKKEML